RDRLIEGSGDEKYRPREIFGDPNAFEYQRLFGELHLDGFEVSHTKDGFRWDENEEPFLALLKERLTSAEMNLLAQARNYRVRATKKQAREAAKKAVDSTANTLERHGDAALREAARQPVDAENPKKLVDTAIAATRTFDLHFE